MHAVSAFKPSSIERTLTLRAAPSEVWRAIIDPELAAKWMGMRLVSSWEVGSEVLLTDTPLGPRYVERGKVLRFEPGALLQYSHWSKLWRIPDLPENQAVLTFRVAPDGDGARLTFSHQLPAAEALAEHSDFFWRVGLGLLKKLVEPA